MLREVPHVRGATAWIRCGGSNTPDPIRAEAPASDPAERGCVSQLVRHIGGGDATTQEAPLRRCVLSFSVPFAWPPASR